MRQIDERWFVEFEESFNVIRVVLNAKLLEHLDFVVIQTRIVNGKLGSNAEFLLQIDEERQLVERRCVFTKVSDSETDNVLGLHVQCSLQLVHEILGKLGRIEKILFTFDSPETNLKNQF